MIRLIYPKLYAMSISNYEIGCRVRGTDTLGLRRQREIIEDLGRTAGIGSHAKSGLPPSMTGERVEVVELMKKRQLFVMGSKKRSGKGTEQWTWVKDLRCSMQEEMERQMGWE